MNHDVFCVSSCRLSFIEPTRLAIFSTRNEETKITKPKGREYTHKRETMRFSVKLIQLTMMEEAGKHFVWGVWEEIEGEKREAYKNDDDRMTLSISLILHNSVKMCVRCECLLHQQQKKIINSTISAAEETKLNLRHLYLKLHDFSLFLYLLPRFDYTWLHPQSHVMLVLLFYTEEHFIVTLLCTTTSTRKSSSWSSNRPLNLFTEVSLLV
jgi:hypothetical protein